VEALDALALQSLPPEAVEVVVVDDGSTDGTWEMLRTLQQKRPNLHALRQPNSGLPSVGRNRGLEHAGGRYVFFHDADDYLAPDALRRLVTFADEMGSDVVVGRVRRIGRAQTVRPFGGTVADADLIGDRVWLSLAPMKLFRRALIERLGLVFPPDMVQGEDQVFVATCLFAAARVSVLNDYDYYYRRTREDHKNISRRPQALENKLLTTTRMTRLIVANTAPGPRREQFLHRVLVRTLGPALGQPFKDADADERQHFLTVAQNEVLPHLTERMLRQAEPRRRIRLLVARVGTAEDVLEVDEILRAGLRLCVQKGVLAYDLGARLNSLVEPRARAVRHPREQRIHLLRRINWSRLLYGSRAGSAGGT
jgi:glycosyltransferase involved in cell wall biosynthesis